MAKEKPFVHPYMANSVPEIKEGNVKGDWSQKC